MERNLVFCIKEIPCTGIHGIPLCDHMVLTAFLAMFLLHHIPRNVRFTP